MSAILNFVRPRWKAIMPLVAALLALAADHVADLDLKPEVKTAIAAVLAAVLVYFKANTPALPAPAPPDGDVGEIGLSMIFRLLALAAFIVVALIGFEVLTSTFALGWLGLGLASWILSTFVA